jgi:tetratricopeptide (TPR) repeat protein
MFSFSAALHRLGISAFVYVSASVSAAISASGLVAAVIAGSLLCSASAQAADPAMVQVEKLIRAGQSDEAKSRIADYIKDHESAKGYIQVGDVYARLKKWDEAVHYISIATTRDENDAEAWYQLGLAQHQANQVDDAVTSLRRAISINRKWIKPVLALGEVLEYAHDRYDARNVYMDAEKKLGDRAEFRSKLCWLFFQDAFWAESIRECSRAHELNFKDARSWTLLAQAYYENQMRPQAFTIFKNLLHELPGTALAYKARGLDYYNEKSYELAVSDLGKAYGFDPTDDEAAIVMARSLFELGQYKLALTLYIEAARLDRAYRHELLAKQRELSKKGKDELAGDYQDALDKL